jgi:hypothetical protein
MLIRSIQNLSSPPCQFASPPAATLIDSSQEVAVTHPACHGKTARATRSDCPVAAAHTLSSLGALSSVGGIIEIQRNDRLSPDEVRAFIERIQQ